MSETPTQHPAAGSGGASGTVKVPLVGPVSKKSAMIGGVVLLGVAYLWWRRQSDTAAGSSVPVDPAAADVGSGSDQSYQPATDGSGGGGSSGSSTGDQVDHGPPFSNNEAWAQYVTAYLVDVLNQDSGAVGTDIGAYMAGLPVSSAQRDIINMATAYGGLPPISGPNGYPPSINVSGSVSGPGSIPGAVSLVAGPTTTTAVSVDWQAVTGANGYHWTASGPAGYTHSGSTVDTSLTLTNLKPGAYTITVHATSSAGAGPDASITISTKGGSEQPPSVVYDTVTVTAYHSGSPAWDSTLWGIAAHYGYGEAQTNYLPIWNDPRNAGLKAKRGTPEHIQAGDTVYVKRK